MGKKVNVVEIGPRDGFQSVKEFIPTEFKIQTIDGLVKAGFQKIQCTSFVSPKAIAQMQDAADIAKAVLDQYPGVDFFALVPNYRGAQNAVSVGFREITPVISLSVSHNKSNVRRTHEESLDELMHVRQDFPDVKLTPDIATVFGCPFEGKMEIAPLIDLLGRIKEIGVDEFTLCDTIGVAYPQQIKEVLKACREAFPDCKFNLHIHDTRNMGILNSYTGVLCGADSIQTSVGGLGGCPFAPGATGNTSSEDFIYMLHQEGFDTGIDFEALLAVAKDLHKNIPGNYSGHHINITVQQCSFN